MRIRNMIRVVLMGLLITCLTTCIAKNSPQETDSFDTPPEEEQNPQQTTKELLLNIVNQAKSGQVIDQPWQAGKTTLDQVCRLHHVEFSSYVRQG